MVTYEKLWEILSQKNMKKNELMKQAEFSSTTLTKLNKNEIVALPILVKICRVLNCQLGDVVEISEEAM